MQYSPGTRESMLITILNRQNATWQGTVTFIETNQTKPFRSVLELIKLIDSTNSEPTDSLSEYNEEK